MKNKFLNLLFFGVLVITISMLFFNKNKLNNFISEKMKLQLNNETSLLAKDLIDLKYNYSKNGQNFEFTLLEFSSGGCAICKRMEGELEKIKKTNANQINVVMLNTNFPENQILVKYFGIAAIPMQVLLDKNGREFFKNYGFLSAEDIITKTISYGPN